MRSLLQSTCDLADILDYICRYEYFFKCGWIVQWQNSCFGSLQHVRGPGFKSQFSPFLILNF